MDDKVYTISQAAKEVGESTSVLRYWEEVLGIRISRDQKGYRCYTGYDIQLFLNIKELKKRGLKLEAIRDVIPRIYQYGPGSPKSKTKLLEDPGEDRPAGETGEAEEIIYVNGIIDIQEVDEEETICEIEDVQETGSAEEILEGEDPAQDAEELGEIQQEDQDQKKEALDMDPMDDLRITEFQSILEKLIAQGVKEKNQEELRIRKLDEKIRFHQQSLKQVAAAQEMKQRRGRGRRRRK